MPKISTSAQFRAATDLAVVVTQKRSADPLFPKIERLLDQIFSRSCASDKGDAARVALLGKLYYTLDRWLLLCDRGSGQVNSRRHKGVSTPTRPWWNSCRARSTCG